MVQDLGSGYVCSFCGRRFLVVLLCMALIVLLYSMCLGRDYLVIIKSSLVGGYSYTVLVGLCLVYLLLVFYSFRVVTFLTRL